MGNKENSQQGIAECLALTHALENLATMRGLHPDHRRKLATELVRIAGGVVGEQTGDEAANRPEEVKLAAKLKFDEQSDRVASIVFDTWPHPHGESLVFDPWPHPHEESLVNDKWGQRFDSANCKTCGQKLPKADSK